MGRKQPPQTPASRWPVLITAGGFFLAEVVVLAGAASPFRLPKDAVALAALCVALAAAVISAAHRRTVVLPRGWLALITLTLPALQAVSALWSTNPQLSMEAALLTLIWVLGVLWMATLEDVERRRIAIAAIIGVACSVVVMFLQLAGVSVFNFASAFSSARLSLTGLTGNPADLAMAAVLLVPFLLVWGESSSRPWFFRSLTLLFGLATLVTQTLTGIVALGAVMLVWLVQQRSRKLIFRFAGIATIVVAIALAAGLGDRLRRQVEQARSGNWYIVLSARGDGWTAAEEMIRNHAPLGIGAAAYSHQYYPNRLSWLTKHGGTGGRDQLASHFQWAHCDPLQMISELGIPGIVWMLLFLWAVITSRRRLDPLPPMAVVAIVPFVLLHYPTHIAVGLIPVSLWLAHMMANARPLTTLDWRTFRVPVAIAVAILGAAGAFWQLRRVAVDVWMGGLEIRMSIAQPRDPRSRAQLGTMIEAHIAPRMERLGVHAPAVLRTLGRARLLKGDAEGAETAFRLSYAAWPHEDAEFYLGMSLYAQGRRNEALAHLSRVCRTNPQLVALIADDNLRQTVTDVLETYSSRQRGK